MAFFAPFKLKDDRKKLHGLLGLKKKRGRKKKKKKSKKKMKPTSKIVRGRMEYTFYGR